MSARMFWKADLPHIRLIWLSYHAAFYGGDCVEEHRGALNDVLSHGFQVLGVMAHQD